jgi:hypothetical protein
MQSSEQLTKVVHEWAEVFMHLSMHDFKRFMNDTGLSFSQFNILMRLFHRGGAGVSEIGELSTIRDSDWILVMNNGDIVEQGKYEKLLAKKGFYADLYNSQF